MINRLKLCHCGSGKRFKHCHGKIEENAECFSSRGGRMKIGKDSVVMGNVPADLEVGEGCVIIGATDNRGNCIINQPMAVGRNAHAEPGSIAIGAGAGAGTSLNLVAALKSLSEIARNANDHQLQHELAKIMSEFSSSTPSKSVIHKSWEIVKSAATLNGAHALLAKISATLGPFLA